MKTRIMWVTMKEGRSEHFGARDAWVNRRQARQSNNDVRAHSSIRDHFIDIHWIKSTKGDQFAFDDDTVMMMMMMMMMMMRGDFC